MLSCSKTKKAPTFIGGAKRGEVRSRDGVLMAYSGTQVAAFNVAFVTRSPSDRERTKKRAVTLGTLAQKLTIGCSLILILAASFCGWRYWTVTRESSQLDTEIAAAQQETGRLRSIIVQVQQFEQRKAQLQQRVVLIEQLVPLAVA